MKRITLLAMPFLLFCLMAASCPPPAPDQPKDPYQTARTTINIMQTTLTTGKLMFDGVAGAMKLDCTEKLCGKLHPDVTSADYKTCLGDDHSAVKEFRECYVIGAAVPWVHAGISIGLAGTKTAKEAVQLSADLAMVRNDKTLKAACAGGDQKACDLYNKRVEAICLKVDPTKGTDYKLCVDGKPVAKANYAGILKTSACLAWASLKPVPANPKYDLYINGVRTWLQIYGGCK